MDRNPGLLTLKLILMISFQANTGPGNFQGRRKFLSTGRRWLAMAAPWRSFGFKNVIHIHYQLIKNVCSSKNRGISDGLNMN